MKSNLRINYMSCLFQKIVTFKLTYTQLINESFLHVGVKGTEVAVVKVNREFETGMKVTDSIPGITSLYSFSYERYM